MDLILNHAAEIALRTLGDEDRRRVHVWLGYLKNWEEDKDVRSRSRKLDVPDLEDVYVLTTSSDLRLFFILRPSQIEVIDIARRDALLKTIRHAS